MKVDSFLFEKEFRDSCCNVENDNEFDWFFDERLHDCSEESSLRTEYEHNDKTYVNFRYTDEWLCSGLSFVLCSESNNCFLPLLALRATQFGAGNTSIFQMRNYISKSSSNVALSLSMYQIVSISGKLSNLSQLRINSVVFSTTRTIYLVTIAKFDFKLNGNFVRQPVGNACAFDRTIVWFSDEQTSSSFLGNSAQALATAAVSIISADQFISRSEQQQLTILDRLISSLVDHKVDLLLCSAAVYSQRLSDLCALKGITVLMMSPEELRSAALLSGATVVDDIATLDDNWVGKRRVRLRYMMEISRGDGGRSRFRRHSNTFLSQPFFYATNSSEREADFADDSTDNAADLQEDEVLLSLELDQDLTPIDEADPLPMSVVICAVTEAMTEAMCDSFKRVLYQLLAVIFPRRGIINGDISQRSGVIPGAGVLDFLTAVHLEQVAEELEHSSARCSDTEEAVADSNAESAVILKQFIASLFECPRSVMIQSGLTWSQADAQMEKALSQFRSFCNEKMVDSCSEKLDVLTVVAAMSDEEKISLASHFQRGDIEFEPGQIALEVASIRVDSFRAAISEMRYSHRPKYQI